MAHQPIEKLGFLYSNGWGYDMGGILLRMLIVGLLSVTIGALAIMVFV